MDDDRWLRMLAPHLPLQVPETVAIGEPAEGYPLPWSLVRWVEGQTADADNVDLVVAAAQLGEFVAALQRVPTTGGRLHAGTTRGAPLRNLDSATRPLIAELGSEIDAAGATRVWDEAVSAPPWQGPPVWLHRDLQPGNLIVREARLVAVIDFGDIGIGDPAVDLMPAWNLFEGASRDVFLDAVGYDEATRARARGWVLAPALQGFGYYRDTFPEFAEACRRRIAAVVAD